jgi:hypothetical protein
MSYFIAEGNNLVLLHRNHPRTVTNAHVTKTEHAMIRTEEPRLAMFMNGIRSQSFCCGVAARFALTRKQRERSRFHQFDRIVLVEVSFIVTTKRPNDVAQNIRQINCTCNVPSERYVLAFV